LNQVCLIRETKNTRIVGVPPGTGLGKTALENENKVGPRAGVRRGHAVMFRIDGTPGKYDQNWL